MSYDKNPSGVVYWVEMLSPFSRGIVAIFFVFTIWCVVTGFDLGNLMNKYADASMEQRRQVFQVQQRQLLAAEEGNQKLDSLLVTVQGMSIRIDEQNERLAKQEIVTIKIQKQVQEIRSATSLIAHWACEHEKKNEPEFCAALSKDESS